MVNPDPEDRFSAALAHILRPLVRALIARGLRFPEFSERMKALYIEVTDRHFGLGTKRLTDSRVSLLTGLQRKDVRTLRLGQKATREASPGTTGPLPRIVARWTGTAPYAEAPGLPVALSRLPGDGPSFEALVGEVSRDIHPRTVLDEMLRMGLVAHDSETDLVTLTASAFLPRTDDTALVSYFGANLGDHAEAAVGNLLSAPEPGPFFERAVHYNRLTPDSLNEIEALARDLGSAAIASLNARALELQARDDGEPSAVGRFRFGAFLYREDCRHQGRGAAAGTGEDS